MQTRTSKIARLPDLIRNELNTRLDNGHFGNEVLDWLNALPEVQAILKKHFDANPITKQNLSEWKTNGGYRDWCTLQDTKDTFQTLKEHTADLEAALNPDSSPSSPPPAWSPSSPIRKDALSDKLSLWLTARYMVLFRQFEADTLDDASWKRFRELTKDVVALRRGDHQLRKMKMHEEECEYWVKDDLQKAWNLIQEQAGRYPDVMERLKGALNLYRKRRNRDYRDYEADGETLSTGARPSPRPATSTDTERSSYPPYPPSEAPTKESPTIARAGAPSTASARPTCTPTSAATINPIIPITPIAERPTEPAAPKRSEGGSNPVQPSLETPENHPQTDTTAINPAQDPYSIAYNKWFRMNSGAEPFNYEELQKLYAAVPDDQMKDDEQS